MADSINNKAKEYYDNDDTGGSLNNNLKDFLKQQGAEGNSLNTLWRNYAYGEGGNSLNTRLGKLWGTSGSLISRWKDVLGLTWDELKLFFNARRNDPELLLSGATSFDGDDDYISVADSDSLSFGDGSNDSAFSISSWIKADSTSASGVLGKNSSNNAGEYYVNIASNVLYFRLIDNSTNGAIGVSFSYSSKEWNHLSFIYDGSGAIGGMKIYLNGVAQSTSSASFGSYTAMENTSNNFIVGRRGTHTDYFNGSIANVGIWNRALSLSEIESIYWKGQYADLKGTELTNLVSWYNLSADANDSTGTNNGTNNGATFLTDAYSASSPFLPRIQDKASDTVANYGEVYGGNAVSFDGTNDYIDTGNTFQSTFRDSFSLSMWVKPDDGQPSAESSFFGTRNSTSQDWIQSNLHTDGKVSFFYRSDNDTAEAKTSSAVFANGATSWTHIGYVADDSDDQLKIYVNGSIVSVTNGGLGSVTMGDWTSSDELFIGARDNNSTAEKFFDGSINNVKIFSTALTQDQVRELYTKPELTLPTGIASSALKLDMPMQEGSGVAILDGSGNQNHGTGDGITWATGQEYGFQHPLVRSNNPMVFGGSNDHINLNGFKFSGNQASFSFWAKFDSLDAPDKVLMDLNPNRSIVYYTASTGLNIYSNNATVGFGTLNINTWYHIVGIFDGTTARMYVNGSQFGTDQTIVALDISSATSCKIGSNYVPSGGYVAGMINEVAVWDSVLTANEVTALYNSGLPLLTTADSGNYASADDLVGYWRNDGVTTWLDRSTNSNNGTVAGDPASIIVPEGLNEGRDSQGYYLTDTDSISSGIRFKGAEYISVQDSETLSFGNGTSDSPFSLEAWIKPNDVTNFEVFAKGIYNSTGEYLFGFEADDKLKFYLFDESVASTTEGVLYNTSLTSSEGQWMHIVGTYDGRGGTSANAGMKIYLNGSQVNNGTESAGTYVAMENLSANLEIGKYSSNYAKGSIDEAKVYSKELSATEVLKNYNNGKSAHSN